LTAEKVSRSNVGPPPTDEGGMLVGGGEGTINATTLAAAVGNARAFRRGRDMAAWLGLTPRQMTTGGKPRLLGSANAATVIFARI
jgi:hypothetical protein